MYPFYSFDTGQVELGGGDAFPGEDTADNPKPGGRARATRPLGPSSAHRRYLLRGLQEAASEAVEDVHGPLVVVLQGRPHHHVVVGILIEVPHRDDGGPESGILVAVGILQRSVVNKPVL